jgi:GNAT superfamily N-acetyltransferase
MNEAQPRPQDAPYETLHAIVRRTTHADIDAIRRIVAGHPNLLPRSRQTYERAVDSGLYYVVAMGERLIAVGGIFPIPDRPGEFEMGNAWVDPEFRGFGLQRFLIPIGAAAIVFVSRDAKVRAEATWNNEASIRNIMAGGFVTSRDQTPLVPSACNTCARRAAMPPCRTCCMIFYSLSRCRQSMLLLAFLRLRDPHGPLPNEDGRSLRISINLPGLTSATSRKAFWWWLVTHGWTCLIPPFLRRD